MIGRSELVDYLHTYLACDAFNDYAPNGLQVEGSSTIKKLCTAVTASQEVIQAAIDTGADTLLVHHGFFWRGEDACVVGMKRARLHLLLQHNINLLAYHLPLDSHAELGNNRCLATKLAIDVVGSYPVGANRDLLWVGTLPKPLQATAWQTKLAQAFDRQPLLVQAGEKPIHRVAWCSGGAQDLIEKAYELGADAYLSGEISERTYYQAKELGIHYFACGHHATERLGVQALGEHLAAKYSINHSFIDTLNPI